MLKGLRIARESAGLSQESLSKQAGMSQGYISILESGRTRNKLNTPYWTITKLSEVLGVSPNFLLEGERNDGDNKPE